jgi:crotonobetaine/carnitine-CoA ligase
MTEPTQKSRELVFHYLVERLAKSQPGKPLLVMNDKSMTYAEVDRAANRIGRGFAEAGVAKGDRVLVMLPNSIDYVLVWLGLCKIGALMVPVNEAYKAGMLLHQANDSGARLAVIWNAHLPVWHDIADRLTDLAQIFVYPDGNPPGHQIDAEIARWTYRPFEELPSADSAPLPPAVEYWDPMAIFYTSGTTGPSKGVLYSYAQAHATAAPAARVCAPDDIFYMFLPMYHVGLSNMFGIVIINGATMAIREKFSVGNFWSDVRRYRATMSILLSSMSYFLTSPPPAPEDRDHTLKKLIMIPLVRDLDAFKARFGCEVTTFFNMTEVSAPLSAEGFDLVNVSSCGRPRPGVRARLVDEHDEEVPVGAVGELALRADDPWQFNLGYWRNPQATAEAWRNQWLHTGDAFTRDADGNFYFVDRIKDCLRRRGENISSFEVEVEVNAHPAILESAAVAVPSPTAEDEIKVVAALKPGQTVEPGELCQFLAERLPRYMVPRYIEVTAAELPKTPTGKVKKNELRATGTKGAWDREGK